MTDADVADLADELEGMRAAARDDDSHAVAEADARFHGRIVELADNGELERVWGTLAAVLADLHHAGRPGRRPEWSAELHAPILAAIERRDTDATVTAIRATLRRGHRGHGEPPARRRDRAHHDRTHTQPKDLMTDTPRLSEEFTAGPARLRVDVYGSEPIDHLLDDMSFLDYRLADVRISPAVTVEGPDILWLRDAPKGIAYDGRTMTFSGPWPAGPIQKVVVTMLALRMEEAGLHPFHASAVRYRDKTVLFLGGESNHGKSMGQIEACRRGALLVSTETTVIDESGVAVAGSKSPFLKKRTEGTERADKAAPERGVDKFFGSMPTWEILTEPTPIDVVIVPAIDGNFDPSTVEMIPFERQFQTFHSVQNYFLLNELLAPGFAMPVVDTDPLRAARADFVGRFAERPYFFIRAANAAGAPRRDGPGALDRPMRAFDYERPTHLDDAVALLDEHGPEARLLAGGTDLIIRLRDGTIRPRVVVDVKGVEELDAEIREADGAEGGLTIGARAVMTDIAADERIARDHQALAEAAAVVGAVQIRNRATLAGNICNASPAADTVPALLVFGARVVVAGPAGVRRIPVDDVFVRSGVTTLARGELVTAIELPRPAGPTGSVHVRRTRRRGHDLAAVTLACAVDGRRRDPDRLREPRPAAGPRRR